jgi:predicted site-specific integrase-resolvase
MGVCSTTLRRWDKQGIIKGVRTPGNHRRIHISEVQRIIDGKKRRYINKSRGVVLYVCYARVSSHEQKQKGDLERQIGRLRDYVNHVNQNLTTKKTKTNNNNNNNNKTTSNIENNNKITSNIENNNNNLDFTR